MKKVLFNHHIDLRFLLTPVASTCWIFDKDGNKINKRFWYVFGIRVISYVL